MGMHEESLDWLAQRYVLGELAADEVTAFETRLADDELAAAAVADAARLVMALETAQEDTTAGRPSRRSWAGRIAIGLAGLAAAVAIIGLLQSRDDVAGSRSAELAERWAEIVDTATAEELADDDDASVGDDVPDWLLAAVTLEQNDAVQEN